MSASSSVCAFPRFILRMEESTTVLVEVSLIFQPMFRTRDGVFAVKEQSILALPCSDAIEPLMSGEPQPKKTAITPIFHTST